jgi:multiple antibiotic resistance protein
MMDGLLELASFGGGVFAALFPIVNPVGAAPVFYSLTSGVSASERLRQARHTAVNVVAILVAFLLGGRLILEFFGSSEGVLQIAGGLIVGHTAWQMVSDDPRLSAPEQDSALHKADISFTPMALPLLSGPGAIGVVTGLSARFDEPADVIGSVLAVALLGVVVYVLLAGSGVVLRWLGPTGLGALSRVLGFFILAIAVSLVVEGLRVLLPVLGSV